MSRQKLVTSRMVEDSLQFKPGVVEIRVRSQGELEALLEFGERLIRNTSAIGSDGVHPMHCFPGGCEVDDNPYRFFGTNLRAVLTEIQSNQPGNSNGL